MKILSFGAGMQSTALALMACENAMKSPELYPDVPVYDAVIFCDLGLEPPNDPLTLEELREMDGEPVWVCDPNDHLIGRYGLVWVKPGWHQDNFCVQMLGGIRAYFSDYSNTWIAYRRRPEGTCND